MRFEVWDTGIGVAPADTARIFEEFVQVGNPERDRRKGLGLGLAIAQRTAALLNTEIVLTSRLRRGSVFRFSLPCAVPLPSAPAEPAPVLRDMVAGLRVLVIDDEETIRDGFTRLLGAWGADILAVADADEAAAQMGQGRYFDVVLADYRLREHRTGIDAIAQIRAQQTPPPLCCLITGDMDANLMAAARQSGLPLLHKPVRPAQLRAVLNYLAALGARSAKPVVAAS